MDTLFLKCQRFSGLEALICMELALGDNVDEFKALTGVWAVDILKQRYKINGVCGRPGDEFENPGGNKPNWKHGRFAMGMEFAMKDFYPSVALMQSVHSGCEGKRCTEKTSPMQIMMQTMKAMTSQRLQPLPYTLSCHCIQR